MTPHMTTNDVKFTMVLHSNGNHSIKTISRKEHEFYFFAKSESFITNILLTIKYPHFAFLSSHKKVIGVSPTPKFNLGIMHIIIMIMGSGREKTCLWGVANNKGADYVNCSC